MDQLTIELNNRIYVDEINLFEERPVVVFDFRNAVLKIKKEDKKVIRKHIIKICTRAYEISKDHTFVLNVLAYDIKKHKLPLTFLFSLGNLCKKILENRLYKCFIHRPSKMFKILYAVIYPLIDKGTRPKIIFVKD